MNDLVRDFKAVYNKGLNAKMPATSEAEAEQMLALLDFVSELKQGGLKASLQKSILSGVSLVIDNLPQYDERRPFSVDVRIVKSQKTERYLVSLGNDGLGKSFAGLARSFQIMAYGSSNIEEPREGFDLRKPNERKLAVQYLAKEAAEDIHFRRVRACRESALLGAIAVPGVIGELAKIPETPGLEPACPQSQLIQKPS